MAVQHYSELLDVNDCKIRPLLTDPTSGSPTYGSWIDVPDITEFNVEGDVDTKTRKGDGLVRSKKLVINGLTVSFTNTLLSLDVRAALQGGTVVDSGTAGTAKASFEFGASNLPSYVEIAAQCTGVSAGVGSVFIRMYKAQLNNIPPVGFGGDDFKDFEWELGAVARNADNKYGIITIEATASDLGTLT